MKKTWRALGFIHSPFIHWFIDTCLWSVSSVTGWSRGGWVTGDPDNDRQGLKDTNISTGNSSSLWKEGFLRTVLYQQEIQCSFCLYNSISILSAALNGVKGEGIHYLLLPTFLLPAPPFHLSSLLLAQGKYFSSQGRDVGWGV